MGICARGNYAKKIIANCKGKVVPVLFLNEHSAMKAYWGVEVKRFHLFFDLGTR
jgi:hypothetical protein